jgi:hypothetical protein
VFPPAVSCGTMSLSSFLAIIADIYTPLLGAVYLHRLLQADDTLRRVLLFALLLNLAIAWGWMLTDDILNVWPSWSLDYSTHTAVALAFIVCLIFSAPRQGWYWAASLVGYSALMVMLGYHSVADITSTALVAGAFMLPQGIWCYRASDSSDSASRPK